MTTELEAQPGETIELCLASHARLRRTAGHVTDEEARSPSRLPGWTIAHVLTHIARNADGHTRRLEGALRGQDVPRYPGGPSQRDGEIAEGALRPAAEILADLDEAHRRLEEVWEQSAAAGWPHPELRADDTWPTTSSPLRRLGEVEVHHVDLGLGYEPSDWPEAFVGSQLPILLGTVTKRLRSLEDAQDLLAWISGRMATPPPIELRPW